MLLVGAVAATPVLAVEQVEQVEHDDGDHATFCASVDATQRINLFAHSIARKISRRLRVVAIDSQRTANVHP